MAPNPTRTISYKAWNTPVDYPSWEFEFKSLATSSINHFKSEDKNVSYILVFQEFWNFADKNAVCVAAQGTIVAYIFRPDSPH